MAQRFPKKVRLNGQATIDHLFANGTYLRYGLLQFKCLPNQRNHSRFVISIKRKIGSAVHRNRIKRLIRESLRHQQSQLQNSHDVCVFVTRTPRHPLTLDYVTQQIQQCLQHLNHSADASS